MESGGESGVELKGHGARMGEEKVGTRMRCDVSIGKSRESGSRPKVRMARFLK